MNKYIDQSEIYKATNAGLDIFKHYFPNHEKGKKFKLREGEKTASALINWFGNHYRITDYGNKDQVNSLKAIPFVMFYENLEYHDALKYILKVIIPGADPATFQKANLKSGYRFSEDCKEMKLGDFDFEFKEKPDKSDLETIGRYVTADLLKEYNCKPLISYTKCAPSKKHNNKLGLHTFSSTPEFPIYLFDYGSFKNIYKPFDEKKYRFLWVGDKPKDYIFGLDQIKKQAENLKQKFELDKIESSETEEKKDQEEEKPDFRLKEIYRCSGQTDALNLASLGYPVYWLNSETEKVTYDQFKSIDELCKKHYQILDTDQTGREQGCKNALKFINLHSIELPNWLSIKHDWRGNACKDIKDFINVSGNTKEQTERSFNALRHKAKSAKFWKKNIDKKSGAVTFTINLEFYYYFLTLNNFYVVESPYHKNKNYCYARANAKIVDMIRAEDIRTAVKRFTKEWVKSKNLNDEIGILNKINSSRQISEPDLKDNLQNKVFDFKNYDAKTEYINFQNKSIKITSDNIELVKHEDLPNYILGELEMQSEPISHIIPKTINLQKSPIEVNATKPHQALIDELNKCSDPKKRGEILAKINRIDPLDRYEITFNDEDFIFTQFLKDISRLYWRKEIEAEQELSDTESKEQNLLLANLMFVIGYQAAEFKSMGKAWMSQMLDMKISRVGVSSGGSGKGIFAQSWQQIRPTFYLGARRADITQKTEFIWDGFTRFHNNIWIDDFSDKGDVDFFYPQITGGREVNGKFQSKETLPFIQSGKMHLDQNFEPKNIDASTLRRTLFCGTSDYYHEATRYNDYKERMNPLIKFGREIYNDFTPDEWVKFYNLMAYCIQLQMRFEKIEPPMDNITKRIMLRKMTYGTAGGEDFHNWTMLYFKHCETDLPKYSPDCETYGYFNTLIRKDLALTNFKESISDERTRKNYKSTWFRQSLEAYCEMNGYELNPPDLCGDEESENRRMRRISTSDKQHTDGMTKEFYYINTNTGIDPKELPDGMTEDDLPF